MFKYPFLLYALFTLVISVQIFAGEIDFWGLVYYSSVEEFENGLFNLVPTEENWQDDLNKSNDFQTLCEKVAYRLNSKLCGGYHGSNLNIERPKRYHNSNDFDQNLKVDFQKIAILKKFFRNTIRPENLKRYYEIDKNKFESLLDDENEKGLKNPFGMWEQCFLSHDDWESNVFNDPQLIDGFLYAVTNDVLDPIYMKSHWKKETLFEAAIKQLGGNKEELMPLVNAVLEVVSKNIENETIAQGDLPIIQLTDANFLNIIDGFGTCSKEIQSLLKTLVTWDVLQVIKPIEKTPKEIAEIFASEQGEFSSFYKLLIGSVIIAKKEEKKSPEIQEESQMKTIDGNEEKKKKIKELDRKRDFLQTSEIIQCFENDNLYELYGENKDFFDYCFKELVQGPTLVETMPDFKQGFTYIHIIDSIKEQVRYVKGKPDTCLMENDDFILLKKLHTVMEGTSKQINIWNDNDVAFIRQACREVYQDKYLECIERFVGQVGTTIFSSGFDQDKKLCDILLMAQGSGLIDLEKLYSIAFIKKDSFYEALFSFSSVKDFSQKMKLCGEFLNCTSFDDKKAIGEFIKKSQLRLNESAKKKLQNGCPAFYEFIEEYDLIQFPDYEAIIKSTTDNNYVKNTNRTAKIKIDRDDKIDNSEEELRQNFFRKHWKPILGISSLLGIFAFLYLYSKRARTVTL